MKLVKSFAEVDFTNLRMPAIAVYEHPRDYPDEYAARVFDVDKPTDTVMIKETLVAVQEDIRKHTNMVFIKRGAEDEPHIVGVWL